MEYFNFQNGFFNSINYSTNIFNPAPLTPELGWFTMLKFWLWVLVFSSILVPLAITSWHGAKHSCWILLLVHSGLQQWQRYLMFWINAEMFGNDLAHTWPLLDGSNWSVGFYHPQTIEPQIFVTMHYSSQGSSKWWQCLKVSNGSNSGILVLLKKGMKNSRE